MCLPLLLNLKLSLNLLINIFLELSIYQECGTVPDIYSMHAIFLSFIAHYSFFFPLRILAIHGAKTTKNHTPLVRFASLFYNQTIFQKSV